MRSDLVHRAAVPLSNRLLLVHVAAKLTRKFHRPAKDRLPETINNSLQKIGADSYAFAFTRDGQCTVDQLSPMQPIADLMLHPPNFHDLPHEERMKVVTGVVVDCGSLQETA